MDPSDVRRFWAWFVDNSAALEGELERGAGGRIEELDSRVRTLHPQLCWELGPGEQALNMFAISPSGDRRLLDLTDAIVSMAPQIEGWEFHAAKPPKQWKDRAREFEYGEVRIDATDWQYGLTALNEREFFDIVWVAPNFDALRDLDSTAVGEFVLECEVGEREKMSRFDRVEVVDSIDPALSLSPIYVLRAHLAKLTGV